MTLHLTAKPAKDGGGTTIPGGVQFNDESGANTGPFDLVHVLLDSAQGEILGTKADAKNTATDTTPLSSMSVWKQISASVQALVTGIVALGQTTMAASMPVAIASNQSAVPIKSNASGTGTVTTPASSATDITILAANAARLGAAVFNDSTQILYLLLANAVSSTTNHTVQVTAGSYYETPFGYTGIIKGLWASANGSARVTELT